MWSFMSNWDLCSLLECLGVLLVLIDGIFVIYFIFELLNFFVLFLNFFIIYYYIFDFINFIINFWFVRKDVDDKVGY